jgi:ribosomal protein L3 glutamine methyltransferase
VVPHNELITLRDWVRWGASAMTEHKVFFGHGTDNALDDALELVLGVLHLYHSLPSDYLDARVTSGEQDRLLKAFEKRIEDRIPTAYLTGRAYFYGLEFIVNENVLIPRSPIAELINDQFEPWLGGVEVNRAMDLCTGSGCIGIAMAEAFLDAEVDLLDISPSALDIAQQNIDKHHLSDRVSAIQSDVFSGLNDERYELIVSNPPYVSSQEMEELPAEYLAEPELALEAGDDGMDIVSQILLQAPNYLTDDGLLVVEVGASADLLMERYPNVPFMWIDFEFGGDGVFAITAEQLVEYRDALIRSSH